jgi:signal peptidase I
VSDWSKDPEKDQSELHELLDKLDEPTGDDLPGWHRAMHHVLDWFRETSFIIVMALFLSVLLRTFVFQAFFVPSESMEDTLLKDDRIIASKLSYRFGDIHRGDVIVFHDPSDWLYNESTPAGLGKTINDALTWIGILPSNSGDDLVKRVIGTPGDNVKCCSPDGQIIINGVPINESSYIKGNTNQVKFDIVVPAGRVFVMGDHRGASSDSRFHLDQFHGTVPIEKIVGQVTFRVWPLNRFVVMSSHSDVFSKVPAPQ